MELRNIRTFLCVAEQCSFSKAAAILGYSQSTVTTQIQQLEQEFETLLFERIHKTVRLTASGVQFVDFAQKIMRTAQDAKTAMRKLPEESGHLRIAMAESLCTSFFPDILGIYHKNYPKVELIISTGGTDDIFHMLRHNEADLVYTLDKRIYSSDLVTALERKEEVCFVASPNYADAEKIFTPKELASCDFILTERNMSYRKHLDELMAAETLEIHPFLELGNVNIIKSLLEHGAGISFLPEYAVKSSLEKGTLIKLKVSQKPTGVWRQLIYHKNKWVTPPMQSMIDLINKFEEN